MKNPVPFNELKKLLIKDSNITSSNIKWYKSLSSGSITIKDEIYTLSVTENKIKLIYNSDNIIFDNEKLILYFLLR